MSETVDDAFLVRQSQEGYLDAFQTLVERHSAMAYRVALRMLNDHHEAQDVAQESLVSAWRNLHTFRGDSQFSTWLYQIVTRRSLNVLTRGRVHDNLNLLDDIATGDLRADPYLSLERAATADTVNSAVAALPLPQRTAIVLFHFEGLSYDEVAAVTRSSVSSVRSHLFRARRSLADALADDAGSDAAGQEVSP